MSLDAGGAAPQQQQPRKRRHLEKLNPFASRKERDSSDGPSGTPTYDESKLRVDSVLKAVTSAPTPKPDPTDSQEVAETESGINEANEAPESTPNGNSDAYKVSSLLDTNAPPKGMPKKPSSSARPVSPQDTDLMSGLQTIVAKLKQDMAKENENAVSELQSELETMKLKLKTTEDKLMQSREKRVSLKSQLKDAKQKLESQTTTSANDLQRRDEEIENLRRTNALLDEDRQKYSEESSRLTGILDETKKNLNRTATQLSKLQQADSHKDEPENYFIGEWDDLNRKIENVCRELCGIEFKMPFWKTMDRPRPLRTENKNMEPSHHLNQLTQSSDQYLGSDRHRPLLFQAYIWWVLATRVFDHNTKDTVGLYWAGGLRPALSRLHSELKPPNAWDYWKRDDPQALQTAEYHAKSFHHWRASTSKLLRGDQEPQQKALEYDVRYLTEFAMEAITPFLEARVFAPREAGKLRAELAQNFRAQLETIILQAIALDAIIHEQRARIYCDYWENQRSEHPLWGYRFNEDYMERIPGPMEAKTGPQAFREECVELVVQPCLCQQGSVQGQYAVQKVLRKAKVVRCENPVIAFAMQRRR